MKNRFSWKIFLCLAAAGAAALCASRALAKEAAPEPVVVTGETVEYLREKNKVVASKNVNVTYQDVRLTCDEIVVYTDTREAIAQGHVRVTQKEAFFTGERINYNFDTKKATVIDGYVGSKPWYAAAEEADKLSDKEFVLKKGFATTCDLEEPHYRLQAREVRIYLDDKVVAKNVILFIGDMPIFWWPYYVQPLKGKKPHVSIIGGNDKEWGYYLLTAWRYLFSEKFRGDIKLDYRTKKGLAEGLDNYYEIDELGKGSVKLYYMKENDITAYRKSGETRARWRAQVRHRWEMPSYDTVNIIEFNKLSDEDVLKDYFYREYEENVEPENYFLSTTTKRDYTMSAQFRVRLNKFYTVVERLPEVRLEIKNYRLGESKFYFKDVTSGVYLNKKFASIQGLKDVNTLRVDTYNQLSYVTRILGFLNTTPYIGARETFYSRNRWGDTNLMRNLFTAGINNYAKFYRAYDVHTDFLGIEINRLRHIVTPSADYYYTHQPTIGMDNLNQFDDLDALEAENGIRLALENKLQTKTSDGKGSIDLATLIVSSDYMFRLKRKDIVFHKQKFESVDFLLELNPYPWLFIQGKTKINTKRQINESTSLDFVANYKNKWFIGIGDRFEKVDEGTSHLFTSELYYRFNKDWGVKIYENINFRKWEFMEQEYTVYKDLHCWTAELAYNVKNQEDRRDHSVWLTFRIKAFPNLPIGFKRTYSYNRPTAGATVRSVGGPGRSVDFATAMVE